MRDLPPGMGQDPPGSIVPLTPEQEGEAYLEWLRGEPCAILGKRTGGWVGDGAEGYPFSGVRRVSVEATHVRVRKWGHLRNAIPMDHHLHHELHQHGIETFQAKYRVDLAQLAIEHTERWLRERRDSAF